MKCPTCQAWTEVNETREYIHGTTRRRRACANGHNFVSVEIPLQTFTRARPAINLSFKTITARQKRYLRNINIAKDPRPARDVGADHHLHQSEVSKIRARFRKGAL